MKINTSQLIKHSLPAMFAVILGALVLMQGGCVSGPGGYSNEWLYPKHIHSVYVEMFDSRSFRRGHEYTLTDAVAKRIEAQTPYKIVTDRNLADSVLSGDIIAIESRQLSVDRDTGRNIENEVYVHVDVTWKDLKTGKMFLNNERIAAFSSYSEFLNQDFDYGASTAVNKAAQKIVEHMQTKW